MIEFTAYLSAEWADDESAEDVRERVEAAIQEIGGVRDVELDVSP